jgi:hypothetical protein
MRFVFQKSAEKPSTSFQVPATKELTSRRRRKSSRESQLIKLVAQDCTLGKPDEEKLS